MAVKRFLRVKVPETGLFTEDKAIERNIQSEAALRYILDAWEEALDDGISPETLANAALFAALADLVSTYGEDAVAKMAGGLSQRISHGEFTLTRSAQVLS